MDRMTEATACDACWHAIATRDGSKARAFVYGVVTTGIYCRTGCPSRRPLRANVRIYAGPADAKARAFVPASAAGPT